MIIVVIQSSRFTIPMSEFSITVNANILYATCIADYQSKTTDYRLYEN